MNIIDFLFVLVFIMAAGFWAEYRYRSGWNDAFHSMNDESKLVILKERLSATYSMMITLVRMKVLKLEPTALIGHNNNKFKIDETLYAYIKMDVEELNEKSSDISSGT